MMTSSEIKLKCLKKRLITEILGAKFCFSCDYSAVVSEIRKQAEVLSTKLNFYHWRAHSGAEVDLLIEWDGQYFPIEIKGTSHPKKSDASGIKAFRESYPKLNISKGLVICTCSNIFPLTEQDYALPWNVALLRQP